MNLTYTQTTLTNRELEIIKLITDEFTNYEIANQLFVSVFTVETHRRNILRKLNTNNNIGLFKWALKNGVVNAATI